MAGARSRASSSTPGSRACSCWPTPSAATSTSPPPPTPRRWPARRRPRSAPCPDSASTPTPRAPTWGSTRCGRSARPGPASSSSCARRTRARSTSRTSPPRAASACGSASRGSSTASGNPGPESGLHDVGAVVGATAPEHLARARELMPRTPFLLPGIGAQGGRVEDLAPAFAAGRAGGLVTASRGIVRAHEQDGGEPGATPPAARPSGCARWPGRLGDRAPRVAPYAPLTPWSIVDVEALDAGSLRWR